MIKFKTYGLMLREKDLRLNLLPLIQNLLLQQNVNREVYHAGNYRTADYSNGTKSVSGG